MYPWRIESHSLMAKVSSHTSKRCFNLLFWSVSFFWKLGMKFSLPVCPSAGFVFTSLVLYEPSAENLRPQSVLDKETSNPGRLFDFYF